MNGPHTGALVAATQYFLTAAGGNGMTASGSQTADSWFDSGTSGTASSNYVWNVVSGQSRNSLYQYNLDGGLCGSNTRLGVGIYTTPSVTMNTYHTG